MKALERITLGLAVLSLGVVSSAAGYSLENDGNGHPLWWANMPVEYRLAAGNAPGGAAGEDAVHRAFATWSNASANVSYRFGGFETQGAQKLDDKNVVYWIHSGWPYDSRLAAITFHYYDTRNGRLLDADIIFNGERFSWSVGGSGFDIENTAAHEIGHFGGLGHSADPEATMYARTSAGETKKRTLAPDDVSGLDALYGGTRPDSATGVAGGSGGGSSGVSGGGGGGCAIAPVGRAADAPGELLWIGLLLGLLAIRSRRRT